MGHLEPSLVVLFKRDTDDWLGVADVGFATFAAVGAPLREPLYPRVTVRAPVSKKHTRKAYLY